MFVNVVTKVYPLSKEDVRAAFPNMTFSDTDFPPAPFFNVAQSTPNFDPLTQAIVEGVPELAGSIWRQTWVVSQLSAADAAARAKAKHDMEIPQIVMLVQAREQLIRIGLNSAVQTSLAAMPGIEGEVARMKFDASITVARASTLVAALAQTLSKDAAWLDQFFIDAKKI